MILKVNATSFYVVHKIWHLTNRESLTTQVLLVALWKMDDQAFFSELDPHYGLKVSISRPLRILTSLFLIYLLRVNQLYG